MTQPAPYSEPDAASCWNDTVTSFVSEVERHQAAATLQAALRAHRIRSVLQPESHLETSGGAQDISCLGILRVKDEVPRCSVNNAAVGTATVHNCAPGSIIMSMGDGIGCLAQVLKGTGGFKSRGLTT